MLPLWKSKRKLYRHLKACYNRSQNSLSSKHGKSKPSLLSSLFEFGELVYEACCGLLCGRRARLCLMVPLLAAGLLLLLLLQEDPAYLRDEEAHRQGLFAGLLPWSGQDDLQTYTPFPLLNVDCPAILAGDLDQIDFTKEMLYKEHHKWASDKTMIDWFSNCSRLQSYLEVQRDPAMEFPLAYIIDLQQNAYQVQLLMQAIYSPHNAYCLILNSSSSPLFKRAINTFSSCFGNVLVHNVSWHRDQHVEYTMLDAELACMQKLTALKPWKYLMNLPGDAFPIHSSADMIKSLRSLNDKNYIQGEVLKSPIWKNFLPIQELTLYQGSQYYIATWDFVNYIDSSRLPKQLLQYLNSTRISNEPRNMYWATINFMKNTPGGQATHNTAMLPFVKSKNKKDYRCWTEECKILIDDLANLKDRNNLFTLGLDSSIDHVAIQCLTDYVRNDSSMTIIVNSTS